MIEEDINSRKEFYQFRYRKEKNNIQEESKRAEDIFSLYKKDKIIIDDEIEKSGKLILNGYQNFITNFMSYNENYDRALLMHSTGVGKTITSLSSAINQMKTIGGNIFILGFSKSVFRRELMNREEFGYVSKEEIEYMKNIKENILKFKKQDDIKKMKDMKRKISMRLSKGENGRIYFIGYKMLASKIFIKLSSKANLDTIRSPEDIEFMLKSKWISINTDFTKQIQYSFIICDEIHNLYSSMGMNSWGVCLKYLLDNIKCKTLLLSATPVNNRPEKVVSVVNLLSSNRYVKNDLFEGGDLSSKGKQILNKELRNKVSFLMDRDLESYPKSIMHGEDVQGIKYIKIIKCKASQLQEDTILDVYNNKEYYISKKEKEDIQSEDKEETEIAEDIEIINSYEGVSLEGELRTLNDIVFPSIEDEKKGIYLKEDILKQYSNMSIQDSKNIGLVFRNLKSSEECSRDIDGDFLSQENIARYSGKYHEMLKIIEYIFSNDKGKLFIYHNYVQGSGTCLIKNILKVNGIIEHGDNSSNKTRCSKCYRYKIDHKAECEFKPLTFIYATGYVQKNELEYKLELFNSALNKNGENIGIILGSQAVKESYDFKAVRNIIIAYMPDNISTLIQVLGRAIRKKSHDALEKIKREVNIYILATVSDKFKTFEIHKYAYKTNIFGKIKEINKLIMESSMDLENNYYINFNESDNHIDDSIYSLPFVEKPKSVITEQSLFPTFDAYYLKEETSLCKYIIKRILIDKHPFPVPYEYIKQEIQNASYNKKYKVNRDTSLVQEDSILCALFYLTYHNSEIYNNATYSYFVDSLFQGNSIIIEDMEFFVKRDNNLFLLVSKDNIKRQSANDFYRNPLINFNRKHKIINVNNIVNSDYNTILQRDNFIEESKDVPIELMHKFIQSIEYSVHRKCVEYVVEYFNSMWLRRNKWKMSSLHDSLVKLLFFYNKFNIIIFANYMDHDTEEDYRDFFISKKIKKSKISLTTSTDSHYKNYKNLINTMEATMDEINEMKSGHALRYHKYHKFKDKMLPDDNLEEGIKDIFIPIGHYFDTEIKIMTSNGNWIIKKDFNSLKEFKELKDNKSIIGFLEKDKSGFRISFKIRINNGNQTEGKDNRKIIVGSVCEHYEKEQLENICKKLNIPVKYKEDKKKHLMCDKIKIKLIELELEARRNNSNIRFFKFYWEN